MSRLADIARRAGVSVATVSLALRGRAGVARKTAEKVKVVAEEMGYRPNPLLSSLASKKFRSREVVDGTPLALMVFPLPDGGRPTTYEKVLKEQAGELGYAPTVYRVDAGTSPEALYRRLYHSMVQGIVILGGLQDDGFLRSFDWGQFSVVQCGRYFGPQPFHVVRPNIFQAVKLIFQELQLLGYRRIGYAVGRHPASIEDDDARFGTAVAMETVLLKPKDRVPVFQGRFDDIAALRAWLDRHRPEAMIGFSPGIYWELRDAGYRIPEALGFAAMHATGESHPSGVICSGAQQNQNEIARQSVLLLDQMVRNRERGLPRSSLDVLVRSTWLAGNTVRQVTPDPARVKRRPPRRRGVR
ncbi:MAG: LacI family DNA-binding transcriptional regulator [Terrimicrobiaceae bacterium]